MSIRLPLLLRSMQHFALLPVALRAAKPPLWLVSISKKQQSFSGSPRFFADHHTYTPRETSFPILAGLVGEIDIITYLKDVDWNHPASIRALNRYRVSAIMVCDQISADMQ